MTPTDINQALAKGLNILKFFLAEVAGGVKALKAIGGPYVGVKFIPTGGINASNLADYLSLPMVHACGGSFMVEKQLIAAGSLMRFGIWQNGRQHRSINPIINLRGGLSWVNVW